MGAKAEPPVEHEAGPFSLVIVSNRLPVDRVKNGDGEEIWDTSPGGLVAALEPVMRSAGGVWIGWAGVANELFEPFVSRGINLVPVMLTSREVKRYYEGFSNATLWPLYHDVIAPPVFHREWWDAYVDVNRRFAAAAAANAAPGATVWVHDYQLQLVPGLVRNLRPDVTIGFFDHIPFPPYGIFAQLPWRRQIIEGLLGADVIGFQRIQDAGNFLRGVRRVKDFETRGSIVEVPAEFDAGHTGVHSGVGVVPNRKGRLVRPLLAKQFPISIEATSYEQLAQREDIQERARQIRRELGDPKTVMLGVDRLDYTKGIRHRLKAYGELLRDGAITVEDVSLIQVASPSRERVETYRRLRDEIELTVGRLNGDYSTLGHPAISYLHHGYPREEMVALYLAADVMLVTSLRDGMNLVAKEYVASQIHDDGVLVLSEFTGASDELRHALLINPHDIDGMKSAMLRAMEMPARERRRRMRLLRRRVFTHDVERWSHNFLGALDEARARRAQDGNFKIAKS